MLQRGGRWKAVHAVYTEQYTCRPSPVQRRNHNHVTVQCPTGTQTSVVHTVNCGCHSLVLVDLRRDICASTAAPYSDKVHLFRQA